MTKKLGLLSALAAALVTLCGCIGVPQDAIRVGTYNIRLSGGEGIVKADGENYWDLRKADLVDLVKKMNLDVFGLQEVTPEQAAYLRETLPEFAFSTMRR